MPGHWRLATATVRLNATQTPKSLASILISAPWMMVSNCTANGGSIWITQTNAEPGARFNVGQVIKGADTVMFTGIPLGTAAYNNLSFGTGKMYFSGPAANNRVIVTYLVQD